MVTTANQSEELAPPPATASLVRAPSHARSWYLDDGAELAHFLEKKLATAEKCIQGRLRALICPHAGYLYCANTAAWAWKQIDPSCVKRVFVLGPSHHAYFPNCALPDPSLYAYETPLGQILLDTAVIETLRKERMFETLTVGEDEAEHSVELQLPALQYLMANRPFVLVPIVVGDLRPVDCTVFGQLLLPFFRDPATLFIFSSDFCHWGARFRYTYLPEAPPQTPIYRRIEMLDKEAARYIENHDAEGFQDYFVRTGNTICGHNPILILLSLLEATEVPHEYHTRLLSYSQSSPVTDPTASSVSYAAFAITTELPAPTEERAAAAEGEGGREEREAAAAAAGEDEEVEVEEEEEEGATEAGERERGAAAS